jgi:hypothetical protein
MLIWSITLLECSKQSRGLKMQQLLGLYGKRQRSSGGFYWAHERDCTVENSLQWLELFQNDEPGVEFILSKKAPKIIQTDFELSRKK